MKIDLDSQLTESYGKITVNYGSVKHDVFAVILNSGLAYHIKLNSSDDVYTLTHVKSGRAVLDNIHPDKVVDVARVVSRLTDWDIIESASQPYKKSIYNLVIWVLHNEGVKHGRCNN